MVEFEAALRDPERVDEAIALYGGDLLAEIYDDWVTSERERLRSLCLDALATLARTRRAERDFSRSLAAAAHLLTLDPWREDIVRLAMSVRYESGDAAGALAEYARFARKLGEEMGVAPMPETVALREAIVRNEALPGAIAAPRSSESSAWAARGPGVALRRAHARAGRAVRALAARGARHGTTVAIGGEAGRGKTRLTAELARGIEEQGGRVFAGGTSLPGSRMPYQLPFSKRCGSGAAVGRGAADVAGSDVPPAKTRPPCSSMPRANSAVKRVLPRPGGPPIATSVRARAPRAGKKGKRGPLARAPDEGQSRPRAAHAEDSSERGAAIAPGKASLRTIASRNATVSGMGATPSPPPTLRANRAYSAKAPAVPPDS